MIKEHKLKSAFDSDQTQGLRADSTYHLAPTLHLVQDNHLLAHPLKNEVIKSVNATISLFA